MSRAHFLVLDDYYSEQSFCSPSNLDKPRCEKILSIFLICRFSNSKLQCYRLEFSRQGLRWDFFVISGSLWKSDLFVRSFFAAPRWRKLSLWDWASWIYIHPAARTKVTFYLSVCSNWFKYSQLCHFFSHHALFQNVTIHGVEHLSFLKFLIVANYSNHRNLTSRPFCSPKFLTLWIVCKFSARWEFWLSSLNSIFAHSEWKEECVLETGSCIFLHFLTSA